MSVLTIKTTAGDNTSVQDTGTTTITNAANNILRISAQAVAHNASVVPTTAPGTTPGDVTIVGETLIYTKVLAMTFKCDLVSLNTNSSTNGIPQLYINLVLAAGSSHNFVIPIIPGQIVVWTPTSTTDANGNTYTLPSGGAVLNSQALAANFTITCTPDKYSDVSISGTIELTN